MTIDTPIGWFQPQPKPTLTELRERIEDLRAELSSLELEAYNLEHGPRLDAIAKIHNIMRAHGITVDEIGDPSRRQRRVNRVVRQQPQTEECTS